MGEQLSAERSAFWRPDQLMPHLLPGTSLSTVRNLLWQADRAKLVRKRMRKGDVNGVVRERAYYGRTDILGKLRSPEELAAFAQEWRWTY